ncbi:MAG: protein kinase [Chloroflexota bacterium]|jgi:ribose/xylose/arabinose/galactoside ABC-type transport system permease subunit
MDEQDEIRRHIGRYEVINEIGSGGFSNVYRGRDPVLDREVAIKVMRPFLMSEPEFVVRFRREAKTVANLDHPHIVPVYDHGEAEGQLYLVMKLMPGGSLVLPLAKGPLPWEQVVSLTGEIAAALDYAHKHGLVHRDVKPENILLDGRGQAQVADFGVVKALENSTTTLSMSGGILGSPAYIAPEIWNGQPPTGAADIYALSCLVFEMTTGRKLYDARTPPAAMALHFRPRKYPESWPEDTPPGLEAVLDRGLARDPAERYQTAAAVAKALASLRFDLLAEPYEALQAAIADEKWPEAVDLAESISAQDDNYRNVRQLLAQATAARADSERAVWVNQWREQAAGAAAAGEWQLALTAARQWLQLAPDDAQAKEVIGQAQAALQPVEEQSPAEEPAAEPEPEPDPLADTYVALQEADRAEKWKEAYGLAESIIAQDPGYRDVHDYLARASAGQEAVAMAAHIDQLKSRFAIAATAHDWAGALTAARSWRQLAPDDPQARQKEQQAERALQEAAAPVEEKPEKQPPPVRETPQEAEPPAPAAPARPLSVSEYFAHYRQRLRSGEPGIWPAIPLIIVVFLLVAAGRAVGPFSNFVTQVALYCTIALGVFFVLLIGEVDLSVAAIAGMAATVLAQTTANLGLPGVIAILAALILATLVGLAQGWAIARFKLPAYMLTLGGLVLISAVTNGFLMTEGFIPNHSEAIAAITQSRLTPFWGVVIAVGATALYGYLRLSNRGMAPEEVDTETPKAIKIGQIILLGLVLLLVLAASGPYQAPAAPILLILLLIFWFVASRTRFGRNVYAIGRDTEAARQAGINIRRTRLLVFALSGLMAGAGGVIWFSLIGGVSMGMSSDLVLLLTVVTAPIIGGTSIYGGRGQVLGVFVGSLLVALLYVTDMTFWLRALLLSVIFFLALALDVFFRRRRLRAGLG